MLTFLRDQAKRVLVELRHRSNESQRAALNQQHGLPPERWGAAFNAAGELVVGDCSVASLAEQFGTPLFVLDEARLRSDFERFHGAFAQRYPNVEVAYSYKTNPLPAALQALHRFGALAEVISHFELWLAMRLGVPPHRILFNGPGKGPDAIRLAVREGVRIINIDSLDEVEVIADAARDAGRRQAVGVRVITSVGWSSQFGLTLKNGDALEAFRRLRDRDMLDPVGLHVHLGTGIREIATYLQAVRELMQFARQLRAELGVTISHFDLGGGFGVPTVRPYDMWDYRLMAGGKWAGPVDTDAAPTPAAYADGIVAIVREHYPSTQELQPTLVFEPGRAVTSSSQCLVLRVLTVKRGKSDTSTVIVDGGKNLAMPTGYEYHEVLPVARGHETRTQRYNFFGPLCHPGDSLFVEKPFPTVAAGDLIAIMDAGAYFVPNQTNFSHARPAAVAVSNGQATLVRCRETFDNIISRDKVEFA